MDGKENRIDIDEECKELKALIVELAYNNPYDENGEMMMEESANEMELYSVINVRINHLCAYVHKLHRDIYIKSKMVKALQNDEVPEELTDETVEE